MKNSAYSNAPMRMLTGLRQSGWPAGYAVTGFLFLVYLSWVLFDWVPLEDYVAGNLLSLPINLIAAFAAWRAGGRASQQQVRRAWRWIALAVAGQAAGAAAQFAYEAAGTETYPSIADLLYLSFYPLLFVGILAFPRQRTDGRQSVRFALDCTMIALAGGAAFAYFAVGAEALEGASWLQAVVTVSYPLGDMVLVAAVASAVMSSPLPRLRASLSWIAAAIGFFVVGDFLWGSLVLNGGYDLGASLEVAYMTAFVCFVLAAGQEGTEEDSSGPDRVIRPGRAGWLPYVAIGVATTILIAEEFDDPTYPGAVVTALAAGVLVLLVARQLISLAELRRSRGQLAQAQELARIGSFVYEVAEERVRFSHEGARLLGLEPGSWLEMAELKEMTHPEDRPMQERLIERALLDGQPFSLEVRIQGKDGEMRTFHVRSQVESREGKVVRMHGTHQDVTERRRMEELLEYQASHDPLTGLHNRRSFAAELERALTVVQRYGRRGAVLMIDVDDFKEINDSRGHAAGDAALKAVAATIASRARRTDSVARIGGDEFALVLPETGLDQARTVAEAICRRAAQIPGGPSLSIGVAPLDRDRMVADDVLAAADVALYRAKELGKDQVCVFTGDPGGTRSWVERIHEALDQDRFVLYAQPMIEIDSNRVTHMELLIRMIGEEGEIIPPAAFLPTAERVGLITEIDRWVTSQALGLAAAGNRVSVNLSAPSIGDSEILAMIQAAVAAGLPAGSLIFEITETAAMTNMEAARRFVGRLTEMGCGVALDDFGTGFGSFTYLKHLPTTYLKIDKEFVRDAANNSTDREVIRSITDVAHTLGKKTVAEGVEDRETLETLRHYRVDCAQGYYLGRPAQILPSPRQLETAEDDTADQRIG